MIAAAVGAILLTGISLYAVLGGADFGGGLWDLLAGGDVRGLQVRRLIDEAISPVWEANHVWLIFDLVIFWTAFPIAFTSVVTTDAIPLWLALLGIVLRGSGFAFRKEVSSLRMQRIAGIAFACSSLIAPFFMGTVVGSVASGSISVTPADDNLDAWTNSTAILTGFLFVVACGYLAAVYLTGEARRRNLPRLESYFVRRGRFTAIVAGLLSFVLLAQLHESNSALYARLTGIASPLVVLAGLCGVAVVLLLRRAPSWSMRAVAALGVAAVIWGWGVAQYPYLLPGTTATLTSASAPHTTLVALGWLFVVALAVIGPSLGLLFALQSRRVLESTGGITLGEESTGPGESQ